MLLAQLFEMPDAEVYALRSAAAPLDGYRHNKVPCIAIVVLALHPHSPFIKNRNGASG